MAGRPANWNELESVSAKLAKADEALLEARARVVVLEQDRNVLGQRVEALRDGTAATPPGGRRARVAAAKAALMTASAPPVDTDGNPFVA